MLSSSRLRVAARAYATPPAALHALPQSLFVAIGTSGTVWPASSFVRAAAYNGARCVLLNLEIDSQMRDVFAECHAGPADELVPGLFA